MVAVDLDNGEAVAFGDAAHRDVPVSRAVQASTALPGLYRPVRIGARDFVDGGVKKTAHIHLAIDAGADLVLCVNPIVPIHNDARGGPFNGHLSGRGITYVLDQALRIMLHGRMQYGMERYRREHPKVDILLMEPTRDDLRMFSYHIMRDGVRRIVAEHGYQSVLQPLHHPLRRLSPDARAPRHRPAAPGHAARAPGAAGPPVGRRAGALGIAAGPRASLAAQAPASPGRVHEAPRSDAAPSPWPRPRVRPACWTIAALAICGPATGTGPAPRSRRWTARRRSPAWPRR